MIEASRAAGRRARARHREERGERPEACRDPPASSRRSSARSSKAAWRSGRGLPRSTRAWSSSGRRPPKGRPPSPTSSRRNGRSWRSEKAEINAVLGLAEQLSVRINGLDREDIAVTAQRPFRTMLTRRYALTDTFDSALRANVRRRVRELSSGPSPRGCGSSTSSSSRPRWRRLSWHCWRPRCFWSAAAAVFRRFFDADPAASDPSYLSRLSVAFWSTLLPTAAVAMFLVSSLFFFDYYNVLRGDIGVYLASLFAVIGVVFGVNRMARATLSPRPPELAADPGRGGSGASARPPGNRDGGWSSASTISCRSSTSRWARRCR